MQRALSFLLVVAAFALVPAVVLAVPIPISGTGALGSFTGTFDYTATNDALGTVDISLTNTSPLLNGGFLTAFVFNVPTGADVTSSLFTSSDLDFGLLGATDFDDNVSGAPFGQFDVGASTGGSFEGGGNPNLGLGVGGAATFTFTLSGTGLAGLTAADFLNTLSVPPGSGQGLQDFVVRFRGFADGGSDKVPNNGDTPVPEPSTLLLLSLGLASILTPRFRSRGK
ncbi:MAG: PEP-CTERM sorting domain-containing protein [Vicinamibacteria bacterium]